MRWRSSIVRRKWRPRWWWPKGCRLLALRIKREANWHGIPIIENPPLAQALYRSVEVGQAIPAKLYAAVAEILAFIYRLQGRTRIPRPAAQKG